MSDQRRSQLQQFGGLFVDAVSDVARSARDHAKNVVLAHDIRDLEKKRGQYLSVIGSRIVQLRRAGLVDLARDDKLLEMRDDVAQLDRAIATMTEKKKATAGAGACGRVVACGHGCGSHAAGSTGEPGDSA
ncbi:MAG: hypothetical protein WCP29_02145 [Acidobacteriota bacterium]